MNAFSQPKLLQNRHDYLLTFGLLLLITTFSLTHAYQDFLKLKTFTWQEAKFTVVKQEHKVKKNYTYDQLELKNSDLHFYTHIKHPLKELRGRVVTLVFLTNNITFKNFLTSFFTYSKLLEVSRSKTQRFHLIDKIHELHESSQIANLYAALFWVEPIDPKLRDKLSALGINHLAALSGFHLGFLALILVFCFNLFIKPIQRRFYPHIHRRRFIMILTLLILFTYVWFLDFTPSLVRAYIMMVLGFFFYDRGLKVISYELLILAVLFILAFEPKMLFALGFWFSVFGVLSIFIILKHFEVVSPLKLTLLINIGVFLLMLPWSIYVFQTLGYGQLFSPLASLIFMLFYPLVLVLHLLGVGSILDPTLQTLFSHEFSMVAVNLDTAYILTYLCMLLLAMRYKIVLHLTFLFSVILFTTSVMA